MAQGQLARQRAKTELSIAGRFLQIVAHAFGIAQKIDGDLLMANLAADSTIQRWTRPQAQACEPLVPMLKDNMPEWYHEDVFKPKSVKPQNLTPFNAVTCLAAGNLYSAEPIEADGYVQNVGRQLISEEKALEVLDDDWAE